MKEQAEGASARFMVIRSGHEPVLCDRASDVWRYVIGRDINDIAVLPIGEAIPFGPSVSRLADTLAVVRDAAVEAQLNAQKAKVARG